jgi:hypothetical protein
LYKVLRPQYPMHEPNDTRFHSHRTYITHHPEGTIVAKTKAENGEKKVSQKAMVNAALEHCGWDAKPGEMMGYIKEAFSTDLAPNIISNYKSQIKREGRAPGGLRSRKGSLQVEDFEMVRNLVTRLGADQVRKLVDVVV